MSCFVRFQFIVIFLIASASGLLAHQIPSLTVEAEFGADGSYSLKVNVDPRLFLSDRPSELPPVPVEWYRDQSETELAETRRSALAYLRRALTLIFTGNTVAFPSCTFLPMDGATNMPLEAETREVHLLAQCSARLPEGASDFKIALGSDANVSMILLNSLAGKAERRPQVLFPGETSRAFKLVADAAASQAPSVAAPDAPRPAAPEATQAAASPPAPGAKDTMPPGAPSVAKADAPAATPESPDAAGTHWSRVAVLVLLLVIVLAARWMKSARR